MVLRALPYVAAFALASTALLVLRTHAALSATTEGAAAGVGDSGGGAQFNDGSAVVNAASSSFLPPPPPPALARGAAGADDGSRSSSSFSISSSSANSNDDDVDRRRQHHARAGGKHGRSGGSGAKVIVGLNKKVYKNEKERSYHCPALGRGGSCLFSTERSRFSEAHAIIDVLKDARRAAPLDFRLKAGQLKGVIISEQDKAKGSSGQFQSNKYDFEIGYNKQTATIWRPFMCNEVSRRTNLTIAEVLLRGDPRRRRPRAQELNGDEWPARTGQLAAFVSNCVGWRLEYLRELRKHVELDSYGACLHNNDTCAKSGKRKCDRVVKAGGYKFVFAFENTEESHYVTEKVYTGLRSGAVPVYKGAPEILEHVPGEKSLILADRFDSAAALGEHLRSLLHDDAAYEAHHRWDLDAFAKSEAVQQCPWQCRVCEWVAAKQGALPAAAAQQQQAQQQQEQPRELHAPEADDGPPQQHPQPAGGATAGMSAPQGRRCKRRLSSGWSVFVECDTQHDSEELPP